MYNFKETEESISKFWDEKKIYEKVKARNKKGKVFYFLQGPPYTSGKIHIGHAWNNSLKDILLRYKRMNGLNVWDRAGYDMHGLPTENKVQKEIGLKDKEQIAEYGVEKFVRKCIEFSVTHAKLMDKDLARLGVWMDYENAYYPIRNDFMEGEWWLIKEAWKQERLYKGKKVMHWCGNCETSLAKHELEYDNVKDTSIFLKFKIKNRGSEYLVIWTTTPWTIPFNLGVMVNPVIDYVKVKVDNESWILAKPLANVFLQGLLDKQFKILEEFKGKELEGMEYEHPLYNSFKEIYDGLKKESKNVHRVLLSEEYVTTDAGSGLVHCAPGCGPEDFEVGKRYGIPALNMLDEKGFFTGMPLLEGLRAKHNDKVVIDRLKEAGCLIAESDVEHEYPFCWRCHKAVIFRATEQWFMKIEDLIPDMLKANDSVAWFPRSGKNSFEQWIRNLKDNGITRQRFWGTPVPIWECYKCKEFAVIGNAAELKKLAGKVPDDLHRPWIDDVKFPCQKVRCGGTMSRIPDVLDVWIDSGTLSWNCIDYPSKKDLFASMFPADFVLEATEQIKLWFSMLLICSVLGLRKPAYKNVYMHGMILDYQGMKMSKSLGNIISPYEVVDKYGADVLRYYMCETRAGENINFNWEDVKIKQRNLNILWNIKEFLASMHSIVGESEEVKEDIPERYIISRTHSTLKEVTELFEQYRLDEVITKIETLFLELSREYIKMTRDKAAGSKEEIATVFHTVKDAYLIILKMFATVCPYISEHLYQELKHIYHTKEASIHMFSWPAYKKKALNAKHEQDMKHAQQAIEKILAERARAGIGIRWPLGKAVIHARKEQAEAITALSELIKMQVNIKGLDVMIAEEESVILDTKLTPELESEGFTREIARNVQDARKKSGLKREQKINLILQMDDDLKDMISMKKENMEFLQARLNAGKIVMTGRKEKIEGYVHRYEGNVKNKEIIIVFDIFEKNQRKI